MMKALRILLLLTVTVGVCALAVEATVTLMLGEQVRFPRRVVGAPFGVRINEPGAEYHHASPDVSVDFRINSQGLRADRDYPYEKPPGVRRIVTLGDSYTVGFEVQVEETFSSVMEHDLARRGYAVEVLNAGVSGYSTAEAYRYLERELLRYDPDVVVLSFFGNDLVDNVRSNLFVLEDDGLHDGNYGYVPGGALGDFLNRNAIFSFLSERSNAFARTKEIATGLVKVQLVQANLDQLDDAEEQADEQAREQAGDDARGDRPDASYEVRLTAAILERLYAETHRRGIPLVIQSIPTRLYDPLRLVDLFPSDVFRVDRPDLSLLPAKRFLEPWLDRELLYYTQSQNHWTPKSHELSGRALAALISEAGWLGAPRTAGDAGRASPSLTRNSSSSRVATR